MIFCFVSTTIVLAQTSCVQLCEYYSPPLHRKRCVVKTRETRTWTVCVYICAYLLYYIILFDLQQFARCLRHMYFKNNTRAHKSVNGQYVRTLRDRRTYIVWYRWTGVLCSSCNLEVVRNSALPRFHGFN